MAHKNPDGFMRSPAQTANNAQKTQNEAATPASLQDFGCQAMCFDILDETQGPRGGQDNEGITVTSVGTGTDSVGEDVAGEITTLTPQSVYD